MLALVVAWVPKPCCVKRGTLRLVNDTDRGRPWSTHRGRPFFFFRTRYHRSMAKLARVISLDDFRHRKAVEDMQRVVDAATVPIGGGTVVMPVSVAQDMDIPYEATCDDCGIIYAAQATDDYTCPWCSR